MLLQSVETACIVLFTVGETEPLEELDGLGVALVETLGEVVGVTLVVAETVTVGVTVVELETVPVTETVGLPLDEPLGDGLGDVVTVVLTYRFEEDSNDKKRKKKKKRRE